MCAKSKREMLRVGFGWNKQSAEAKKRIEESAFIFLLGSMEPKSEERETYIKGNRREYEECLKDMLRIIYPTYDDFGGGSELDSISFLNVYNRALRLWKIGEDSKRFCDYVTDEYVRESKLEDDSLIRFPEEILRIVRKVNELRFGKDDEFTVEDALDEIQMDSRYADMSDYTRDKVLEALKSSQRLSLDYEFEGEDADSSYTLGDAVAATEPGEQRKMDPVEFRLGVMRIAEEIESKSALVRKWLRRGNTGRFLKVLKYDMDEPIPVYPAVNTDYYDLFKENERVFIDGIFERGFVEYLICNEPDSLRTMEGVGCNLFREGREVTNKCLVGYISETEKPITEASVSRSLNRYGVSFSGYKNREV